MIPKIIHFCWLSDDPYPESIQRCMDTWKKFLPDYTIKRWSTKSFNLDSVPLAKQAFESKRYAFAADYIRAYALYTEGGIYLGLDVMIRDPHLLFADAEYVKGFEFMPADLWKYSISIDEGCRRLADVDKISGVGLQAAVMASVPGHPLTKKILEYYKDKDLQYILGNNILAPIVSQARCAEEFDFRYTNTEQHLDCGIVIYPTGVIGQNRNEAGGRYMTHMCAGSWLEKKPTLKQRLKKWIKH